MCSSDLNVLLGDMSLVGPRPPLVSEVQEYSSLARRLFRIKDQSFWDLFKPPFEQKVQTIETLIASDPDRRFILVGDSTEVDPEVYGEMARRHPERIVHIFIRNIEGRIVTDERAAEAFADIPAGSWTLFTDATALLSFSPDSD